MFEGFYADTFGEYHHSAAVLLLSLEDFEFAAQYET